MDVREFLHLADKLAQGPTEAEWRSAVSRAYYAAFHIARQLLSQCKFRVPRSDRAHAYLYFRLYNCGHADVKLAGDSLDNLRGERNSADYDMDFPYGQNRAMNQVQVARDIIQALDAAALEPLKTQITDAIKVYERDVLKNVTWQP